MLFSLFIFAAATAAAGFIVVVGFFVGPPLVHGDLAENLAAIETVVREAFLLVEVCEVGHGSVG